MTETLELTPVEIDLVAHSKTTGWTLLGNKAEHEACNAGRIYLLNYPLVSGDTYEISYTIDSINTGYLQPFAGTTGGLQRTAPGFYKETIVANGTQFFFYSNANVQYLSSFDIKNTKVPTGLKQQNTIAYSDKLNKWTSYYTYNPDCAFSLFINMYSYKNGRMYIHNNNSSSRNNFYGIQYESLINVPFYSQSVVSKTFQSISYQGNQLLITSEDGITTSLGQISELIEEDFLKDILEDGVNQVDVFSVEGIYSASFLRDKNIDLINGDPLKGNYITVELKTTTNQVLKLYTVEVISQVSKVGAR